MAFRDSESEILTRKEIIGSLAQSMLKHRRSTLVYSYALSVPVFQSMILVNQWLHTYCQQMVTSPSFIFTSFRVIGKPLKISKVSVLVGNWEFTLPRIGIKLNR